MLTIDSVEILYKVLQHQIKIRDWVPRTDKFIRRESKFLPAMLESEQRKACFGE